METGLKGNEYFEIKKDFFNKFGVLIDGDFKFGVLLLVFARFLGGDTGNLLKVDRVFISFMFKSVNLSILQKTINKTIKSPHAFAMCSIRTDLLKQENEKIDSL